jgi:hypothetical protein
VFCRHALSRLIAEPFLSLHATRLVRVAEQ